MSRLSSQLLAVMLASGAMAHRPEIFLGHDIG